MNIILLSRKYYFLIYSLIIIICGSDLQLYAQSFPSISSETDRHNRVPFLLIIGSFFLDQTIHKIARENQSSALDKIADIDRYYGDKYVTGGALLGLYGMGLLINDDNVKETGEKAIIAAAVSGIVVVGLKEAFGRSRPYRGNGAWHFKPFSFEESRRSLPSGHAAVTFAISTVMANSVDNNYWKALWYGGAIGVGAARIYKNQHWFSDVICGSVIGYFIANKTEELFQNKKANPLFGLAFKDQAALLTVNYSF